MPIIVEWKEMGRGQRHEPRGVHTETETVTALLMCESLKGNVT